MTQLPPNVPYSNIDTITLGIVISTCEFLGDTSIQFLHILLVPYCFVACLGQEDSLGILADGRKCMELWECLTSLYSRAGWSMLSTSCVSFSGKPQVPYILNVRKASRVPKHCITQHDFAHVDPLKVMGILLLLVAWTSGWGTLTDSLSPTAYIREHSESKNYWKIKGQ